MPYTREELDWIEAEWAYHLHGRQAFLSREDFLQVQAWDAEGAPAELVVSAMEAYFQRRAKRPRPRAFSAMAHLGKEVEKALKLRQSLLRAGPAASSSGWEGVGEPLRSDPRARAAFAAWSALKGAAPSPESPGFLDHFDRERGAFLEVVRLAEQALGPAAEDLRQRLSQRLAEAKLEAGTPVWERAWKHHWGRLVCEAWGIGS